MSLYHMKNLFVLILTTSLSSAALAVASDVRCLVSTDARAPIRLQFDLPQGASPVAHVMYQRGSKRILLQLADTSSSEMAPGRPFEVTTTWNEMAGGASSGTYTVITQGARIYGFTYLRARDKKTFEFEEDLDAVGEQRCVWKK